MHEYNSSTYIIRQSGCSDYEKPFLYLLFGTQRAILIDSGSRGFPAAAMVQNVVGKWLARNQRSSVELVVVHSHPHSDHVAGDEQLRAMASPNIHVTVLKPDLEHTKQFYNIQNWPTDIGSVDLGDRVIDAIPIPGHSALSIALYDRNTGILFPGDSLYPGRLYVENWKDFRESTDRLVTFTEGKTITYILGCHIEQSDTPYVDYPVGTIYQPHEHALALSRGALLELADALHRLGDTPTRFALRDLTIWPDERDPKGEAEFKARVKQQVEQKWDQPVAP